MALDKAHQLLQVQLGFGGGYNRNSTRLNMTEVVREHGQTAANQLISEMHLDEIFGIFPVSAQQSAATE